MPWFYGAMDADLSAKMIKLTKRRGAFLVRTSIDSELLFRIDYFDGFSVQTIAVSLDSEGTILKIGIELEREFKTLTEFVNYLHTFPLKSGTRLKEGVKLTGKVILEDCSDMSFKRGESIKIKTFLESAAVDAKDRSIPLDNIELGLRKTKSNEVMNEMDKIISLEKCEINKKTDQSLEIITSTGEKLELLTEKNVEKLIAIIKYSRDNDEVRFIYISSIFFF